MVLRNYLSSSLLNPQTGFEKWVKIHNRYGSYETELLKKFIDLEKQDNIKIYEKTCIDEFKNEWANVLPTIKLGEKDKFVYVPQILGKGEVYIQKADGSVIINESKGFFRLRPKHGEVDGCFIEDLDYKLVNDKKYDSAATYTPTENGIIKTHIGNKSKSIEIDKKHGEIIISKDGYKYYYSIKGRELLDIKKIKRGKPVTLKSYNLQKAGKSGDDTPEIILIKLRGGGTATLYKMPNGKILTPKEFHFPESARQEKDFQNYLKKLEELKKEALDDVEVRDVDDVGDIDDVLDV